MSTGSSNEMNRARIYPAISLISASSLLYEIGLTRIFSLSQGYHFAFMVISIALLGIGAGGATMMLVNERRSSTGNEPEEGLSMISVLAALLPLVYILSYMVANRIMFDPVKAAWSRPEFLKILLQYLVLSLPFVVSGMVLSAIYKRMRSEVHNIYLADMGGAGTGCILVLYVLTKTGGEGVVTVSAGFSLIAGILFYRASGVKGFILQGIGMAAIILVMYNPTLLEIRMSPYRELSSVLNFPGAKVIETILSPSGRMDVIESPAVRAAPGISLSYQTSLPDQVGFTINGGGLATVTSRKGDLSFLNHLPSSLPYRLRKGGGVFIVDVGSGMEALAALENGAGTVWGAETRGVVMAAMKGPLSAFSERIYDELDIRHGYGRKILKRTGRRFDIIQLPLTDTLGSSSSGIMGLQEEYALTVEAFAEYLGHLKDGGFLAASLYLLPPPRQELKLLSTITAALGKEEARNRIIAIRSWGVLTIIAKNGLISPSEVDEVKEFCRDEMFDLVWYPGMKEGEANIYNRFQEPLYYKLFRTILEGDREAFYTDYIFDVRPATDDRPFFGQTFKMTRIRDTYEYVGRKWGILIEGGYLLPWILIQSISAGIILIASPLVISRLSGKQRGGWKDAPLLPITAYFTAIGIGYMFLEISVMQRMIPALGEPVYAVSAVLFALLVSSGAGSYISGRIGMTDRYSVHILLLVPILAFLYLFIIGALAETIAGMDMFRRFLLTFLYFLPLGVVMGMPFPAGMAILGKKWPEFIPWAWCINGCLSVVSSALAMIVALYSGFSTVHLLAVIFYLVAWIAIIFLESSQPSAQTRLP